jgi:hypothetical protein
MYTGKYISSCSARRLGDVNAPGVDASTSTVEPASYMATLMPGQAASANGNGSRQVHSGAVAPISIVSAFFNRPIGSTGFNYGQAAAGVGGLLLLVTIAKG